MYGKKSLAIVQQHADEIVAYLNQYLVDMLIIVGKRLKANDETEKAIPPFKIAQMVMDAFSEDFLETRWFKSTIYEYTSGQRKEIEQLLSE